MRDLKDIIEAALAKGRQPITTPDDEIDDWEPDGAYFRRLDEAKPVKPMKPLKPGETREDAEKAANPNHEAEAIKAQADADAKDVEANAPKNNKAVDRAQAMMKAKSDPKQQVADNAMAAAKANLKR